MIMTIGVVLIFVGIMIVDDGPSKAIKAIGVAVAFAGLLGVIASMSLMINDVAHGRDAIPKEAKR